ncbi:MAG TPA: VTT domain-containing protein [Arachnia sp.]|nr:VTT domain-containing protein [Arachnia sp.]HMT84980.1 VTT domain-containing protein [Arachnia sp.]
MFNPLTWNVPYGVVVATLFCIVMLRANGTYWLGRAMAAGARKTRAARMMSSPHYATATRLLNRWGAPAVTLSFLTIGLQTMVLLTAGVTRMPLRRFLPAVAAGGVAWAFLYGTVGVIGWVAVRELWGRSPLLVIAIAVAVVAVVAWALFSRDRSKPALAE